MGYPENGYEAPSTHLFYILNPNRKILKIFKESQSLLVSIFTFLSRNESPNQRLARVTSHPLVDMSRTGPKVRVKTDTRDNREHTLGGKDEQSATFHFPRGH